jgi:hypothetical protein
MAGEMLSFPRSWRFQKQLKYLNLIALYYSTTCKALTGQVLFLMASRTKSNTPIIGTQATAVVTGSLLTGKKTLFNAKFQSNAVFLGH